MVSGNDAKAIETEFLRSWQSVHGFFADRMPRMALLIQGLRTRGYDRQLRAWQSMSTLFVSRSREHHLRIDQPSLAFDLIDSRVAIQLDAEHVHVVLWQDDVTITPQIENLLIALLAHPID